jgi:hypothetical protein
MLMFSLFLSVVTNIKRIHCWHGEFYSSEGLDGVGVSSKVILTLVPAVSLLEDKLQFIIRNGLRNAAAKVLSSRGVST